MSDVAVHTILAQAQSDLLAMRIGQVVAARVLLCVVQASAELQVARIACRVVLATGIYGFEPLVDITHVMGVVPCYCCRPVCQVWKRTAAFKCTTSFVV